MHFPLLLSDPRFLERNNESICVEASRCCLNPVRLQPGTWEFAFLLNLDFDLEAMKWFSEPRKADGLNCGGICVEGMLVNSVVFSRIDIENVISLGGLDIPLEMIHQEASKSGMCFRIVLRDTVSADP